MAGRRYGSHLDILTDDPSVAPQSDANLVIKSPHLRVGLGDQQIEGVDTARRAFSQASTTRVTVAFRRPQTALLDARRQRTLS
ncbi:hypothetical protein [Bradyrhizobium sp. Ai1a-2]|uniref:hypothetical protein n=1 Tax=Bradyrhizobium sp. Ai1a-2 TaxID=196490 RepID=UPI0004061CF5|nr:hypothetical protein [Bradyrhizobium sp. Ai1a-2]